MNRKLLSLLMLLFVLFPGAELCAQLTPPPISQSPFSIGETFTHHATTLNEDRRVNVYLPLSYHPDSLQSYPVIYLLDGSADEDFIHIAGLVQFGSFSWINMLPETIVVGIANIDRKRDFTYPTRDMEHKKEYPTTGGSANFMRYLAEELQPAIKAKYKTNGESTLIGQSLGGLLATEILFKQPSMFDNYIIISPSLWWDFESLLESEPVAYNRPKNIYVGVGKEGKIMERVAKELHRKLKRLDREGSTLHWGFFKAQNHGDVLHLAAYDAFTKLFMKSE